MLSPAPAGGLERVVQALAIGQHGRSHDVLVIPVVETLPESDAFAAPLVRAGVGVMPIVVPPREYRKEREKLAKILDSFSPDVVHSHGYRTNVVDGGLVRKRGIAMVGSAHGFTGGALRNRVYEWLDCFALRTFDAAIAVSRPLGEKLVARGVRASRLHVVPNAWSQISPPLTREDARAALNLPEDQKVIGWVGRMTHEKGVDVFVDALQQLTATGMTACLVGDGPEREIVESKAKAVGMSNRLVWTGLLQEAGRYFNAFDVLCQSSRTEGIPMVVLEAMAMGIPLVVTAVGGVPDVVSPAEAKLVEPENPSALANALTDAITDAEGATVRAAAAKLRLQRQFSESAWLDAHDHVYTTARRSRSG